MRPRVRVLACVLDVVSMLLFGVSCAVLFSGERDALHVFFLL